MLTIKLQQVTLNLLSTKVNLLSRHMSHNANLPTSHKMNYFRTPSSYLLRVLHMLKLRLNSNSTNKTLQFVLLTGALCYLWETPPRKKEKKKKAVGHVQ